MSHNSYKIRFNKALQKMSIHFKTRRFKMTDEERQQEIELVHIAKRIDDYGFDFFPEHYIKEDLKRLEKEVAKFR